MKPLREKFRLHCPDCGSIASSTHSPGCDVARCLVTGFQRLACGIFSEAHEGSCGADGWTGFWPGVRECEEFGLFTQDPVDGTIIHDINTLMKTCVWDRKAWRWRQKCDLCRGTGWHVYDGCCFMCREERECFLCDGTGMDDGD